MSDENNVNKLYSHLTGLNVGNVRDEVYPEDSLPQRPVKVNAMPVSPGRGKGNLAKATINRTAAFRGALGDNDWEDIAVVTFNRLMDPATKNGDFVKLAMFLARYNLLSADAQMVCDTESGALNPEAIDRLRNLIKDDGIPHFFPKTKALG